MKRDFQAGLPRSTTASWACTDRWPADNGTKMQFIQLPKRRQLGRTNGHLAGNEEYVRVQSVSGQALVA
eukprot:2637979-Prorocentrum_lima.AAC.1